MQATPVPVKRIAFKVMVSKHTRPASLGLCLIILAFFALSTSAQAAMENYNAVQLQTLDKITARTLTFEAEVGTTVRFGPLFIHIQSCRKSPPIENPESAAFLQIWQNDKNEEVDWIFSGWMFASSPAISSMDHPIYDVWVLDCLEKVDYSGNEKTAGGEESDTEDEKSESDTEQNPPASGPEIEIELLESPF